MKNIILIIVFLSSYVSLGQTPSNDPHWETLWEDNFDFYDATRWIKANYGIHGNEPQIYLTSNVFCLNGNLILKANNNIVTCPPNPIQTTWACGLATPGQTYPYNSGWVETNTLNNIQFGYIEARIKLPECNDDMFPAFWTWRGNNVSTINETEIDIFEMIGALNTNLYTTNIHINYPDSRFQLLSPINYNYTDYHLYGIEWSSSKLIWYLDGIPIRISDNPGVISQARVIFNLALKDNINPTIPTHFPKEMLIDYIKVYKLKNDCNTDMNVCNYDFSTHDNRVKKSITIGNGTCTNTIFTGQNVFLRASEGVLINGDFTTSIGSELYIDVNPCYE